MQNAFFRKSLNPSLYRFSGKVDLDHAWAQILERRYTKERGKGWRAPVLPFSPTEFSETEFLHGTDSEFLLLKYHVNVVPSVQSWVKVVFEQMLMDKMQGSGSDPTPADRRELKLEATDCTLKNFPRKPVLMDVLVDLRRNLVTVVGASEKYQKYMLDELVDTLGTQVSRTNNWKLEKMPAVEDLRDCPYVSGISQDSRRGLWEPIFSEFLTWMFYQYMRKPEFPLDLHLPLQLSDDRNSYRYSGDPNSTSEIPDLFTSLLHGSTLVGIRVSTRGEDVGVAATLGLNLEPRSLKLHSVPPSDNVYACLDNICTRHDKLRSLIRSLWGTFLSLRENKEKWGRECEDISRLWKRALQDLED